MARFSAGNPKDFRCHGVGVEVYLHIMMYFSRPHFAITLIASVLCGCTVGPDFLRPSLSSDSGYGGRIKYISDQTIIQGRDIPADWWALFQSPALDKLVRQAIEANPSLHVAQAALKAAHENTLAQGGADYPNVQTGLTVAKKRTPTSSLAPDTADNSPIYTLVRPQLSVSYMLDIWGFNKRTIEALQAQEETQRYQVEATYLTLTSSLVATAIQEASLRGQIEATQQMIHIDQDSLDILRRQQTIGQIAAVDVLAQEAALAQLQQTLMPLENQLSVARNQLTALLGRFPSQEIVDTFTLDDLHLPKDLPLSLPSKLVEQRPDILMAEATMRSASAQVGVALANRLPTFTINGDIGSAATHLAGAPGLFSAGTGFWSLGGNIAATLFDGFSLEHRQKAAEYGLEQTAAQYKGVVITAFQNVSDALNILNNDARALKSAEAADAATAENLSVTRRQLELGAVSTLALLAAQQTQLQAKVSLVQARANRLSDTVTLYQALGGGWWNRS